MYKLSKNSLKNSEGVDPRLLEIRDVAIKITLVDFGIPKDGGLRTNERQNELYKLKKSKVDGYTKRGKHQKAEDGYSKALDFYAFVDGKPSWDHTHLTMVACAFLQAASILGHKIEWGGLWLSSKPAIINGIPYGWDCPHIQLVD